MKGSIDSSYATKRSAAKRSGGKEIKGRGLAVDLKRSEARSSRS